MYFVEMKLSFAVDIMFKVSFSFYIIIAFCEDFH